ncbi:MAG: MBOAT family protein [Prevotellaceae bacterium]|nr:MBOAT family protein [Prevotellaceae bacterium]
MPELDWSKALEALSYDPARPMLFSTGVFLFLFLGFSLVYALLRKADTLRILFVTLFSYYFYYKSSGFHFLLLAVVTLTDFSAAALMQKARRQAVRRLLLILSLTVDLGLLCYFKYTNFFYEMLAPLWHGSFQPLDIFLPVGISFFTFQSLSYTIDVYKRKLQPLSSLLDYAFYVSFFPQLVAGPIVRATDFIPQIRRHPLVTRAMFGEGVFLIMSGLFKKAVISDYISLNFVDRIFDSPSLYSGVENLLGVYGYALQIYCDFSGYSDMAIGIALMLGFRFPDNFRSPYKSGSVTEFWRRWHISLSSWLRDYLYIPLGGNRKGKLRTYVNLLVTMLLGGLWHGASWNFVVWGGMHGLGLAFNKLWAKLYRRKLPRLFSVLLTFHFVCLLWVFFRNSSFADSLTMLRQIATDFHPELFLPLVEGYWRVFALIALGYLLHFAPDGWSSLLRRFVTWLPLLGKALLLTLLIYLVVQTRGSDIQPFIYFQF